MGLTPLAIVRHVLERAEVRVIKNRLVRSHEGVTQPDVQRPSGRSVEFLNPLLRRGVKRNRAFFHSRVPLP